MKFGKKLIAAMRPEWGPHVYVPYESLKHTLKAVADVETSAQAEGAFVEQLMQCMQQAPSPRPTASPCKSGLVPYQEVHSVQDVRPPTKLGRKFGRS